MFTLSSFNWLPVWPTYYLLHVLHCNLYIPPPSPVWPTYDLLHVLHCNLYIPLDFISFCGVLSHNWLYVVLHFRNGMFTSVPWNRQVTLSMSGMCYVYVSHFFLLFMWENVLFFVLINLFLKLWIICPGKAIFLAWVRIVFHSRCLACSVIGVDIILFM
jgi:hypothetical protein